MSSKIIREINEDVLARTVTRCRERNIVIPTFAEQKDLAACQVILDALRQEHPGPGPQHDTAVMQSLGPLTGGQEAGLGQAEIGGRIQSGHADGQAIGYLAEDAGVGLHFGRL